MKKLTVKDGELVTLSRPDDPLLVVHVFDSKDIRAINAALAAERPLLVRGDPGTGKTQLALAAAISLQRVYCHMVVDARTEVRDLRWTEDLVARLAEAQLIGAMGKTLKEQQISELRARLDITKFIAPGPLWWGFDWNDAEKLVGHSHSPPLPDPRCCADNGAVVLIDEIDKAEPELPNGLLEALGSRAFTPRGRNEPVKAKIWPLVIITTNDDRTLPDAFMRRCLVHDISLPETDKELETFLIHRGEAHFPKAEKPLVAKAAELTVKDRSAAFEKGLRPLPGQAEFIELLRAVQNEPDAMQEIQRISHYFLKKHKELRVET